MNGSGMPMSRLIKLLARYAGRPIVDKSNLTATSDFTLKFSPPPDANATSSDPEPVGPSLFTALQEQLGLKLDAAKDPVEAPIIDSIQKPSEN